MSTSRRQQIESVKQIIELSRDPREVPALRLRLGELYWEEARFHEAEAQRNSDELLKKDLLAKATQYDTLALEQYATLVQEYPSFERSDEALFFFGQLLMKHGQDRKALVVNERLVNKYPKSRFYPYALYKQGWCYFNLADYPAAKDKFKAVMLYAEAASAEKQEGGTSGMSELAREARAGYVRAYARQGDVMQARDDFSTVATRPEDRFTMMRQLADLYYGAGQDREAALTFNSLLKEKPLSPESPGFQAKIVDCVQRMGNKERTLSQVLRLAKIIQMVEASGIVKEEKDQRLVDEAKALAERTLSNLAITWHDEARKTGSEEAFTYADAVSSGYLVLFPNSPKAPDIRKLQSER